MTIGMENRRREERYNVNAVLTVNDQLAMIKDLSQGGMRVSAMNLKPQQLVDLTLQTSHDDEIAMKALVRWVRRTFPFESYCECGLALISAPGAYQTLCDDITVPPKFSHLTGLWPVSLVLVTLASLLMFWL